MMSAPRTKAFEGAQKPAAQDVYARLVEAAASQQMSLEQWLQHMLEEHEAQSFRSADERVLQKLLRVHRQTRLRAAQKFAKANAVLKQESDSAENEEEPSVEEDANLKAVLEELEKQLAAYKETRGDEAEESLMPYPRQSGVLKAPETQKDILGAGDKNPAQDAAKAESHNRYSHGADSLSGAEHRPHEADWLQFGSRVERHFQTLGAKINQLLEGRQDLAEKAIPFAGQEGGKSCLERELDLKLEALHKRFEAGLAGLASKKDLAALELLAKMQIKLNDAYHSLAETQGQLAARLKTAGEGAGQDARLHKQLARIYATVKAIRPSLTREVANLLDFAVQKLEARFKTQFESLPLDQKMLARLAKLEETLKSLGDAISPQGAALPEGEPKQAAQALQKSMEEALEEARQKAQNAMAHTHESLSKELQRRLEGLDAFFEKVEKTSQEKKRSEEERARPFEETLKPQFEAITDMLALLVSKVRAMEHELSRLNDAPHKQIKAKEASQERGLSAMRSGKFAESSAEPDKTISGTVDYIAAARRANGLERGKTCEKLPSGVQEARQRQGFRPRSSTLLGRLAASFTNFLPRPSR